MLNKETLKPEDNSIVHILDRSIKLFKRVGNTELAEKWSKILKNYYSKIEES